MSPLREAVVLPCLFLTVTLLGGLRVGSSVKLLPPQLIALVLAMLLVASLARSGTVIPERLMSAGRTPLENLSGLVVLLTLFAASAQVFNLLTPDSGLLHLLVSVFFLVQLLTTLAAVRDRLSMLRSLAVLLGCAFFLRFIALESLYSPGPGVLKRVMTALMEGITLGTLDYEPAGAATGYIAFFTLTLFVIALVLVGAGTFGGTPTSDELVISVDRRSKDVVIPILMALLVVGVSACDSREPESGDPPRGAHPRDAALAAARVWRSPEVPISSARLGDNPAGPGSFGPADEVSCRFVPERVDGLTSKFNCELPDGEIVKVKYGVGNAELHAEAAATRLLSALGFGADRMYVVNKVRCAGCPPFPFPALQCFAETGLKWPCFAGGLDYKQSSDFQPAVIERRMKGRRIESVPDQGWAWYELDRIEPARGGASRAEVDALRLVAMILAHWDNKAENQRLLCLPGAYLPNGLCSEPLAMIQDLGATFGPNKLELTNWRHTPVWQDARTCHVSMRSLPYGGATYPETQISEEGRRLLLGLLEQLSFTQLRELFAGSGVMGFDGLTGEGRDPDAWARAFLDKVRQVREAGPCPTSELPS
jgi:hypothetical protein